MSTHTPTVFPHAQAALLEQHAKRLRSLRITDLLARDKLRRTDFTIEAAGLSLDYSRALLDRDARTCLLELAVSAGLEAARNQLFSGEPLNHTENRAALHTLLRSPQAIEGLEGEHTEILDCRARMLNWVARVRSGEHLGYSGKSITDIVNIGIGGSDLGPRVVCQALTPFHQPGLRVHFCANIDPSELQETLKDLDPSRTLFIICSKTLRTEETLHNAQAARQWIVAHGKQETAVEKHFLAVSTNLAGAREFGIPDSNILPLWDWVGGRYSLWSAIGWSIAFAIGAGGFEQLLAGAHAMDRHFLEAPPAHNMPAILSLLEIWYVNFMGAGNHAVIPYCHYLARLPAFLQQLSMESNGKQVNHKGETIGYATAPVLWGEQGTNGQHSFHQLLHQGTALCPVDFILPLRSQQPQKDMHARLVANCIAQGQALMLGRNQESCRQSLLARGLGEAEASRLAPHLVIPGNRPSNTISCERLTPETLGALLSLYEHKTFCSGHIWQINSFDQWGVELGKILSGDIYSAMERSESPQLDASTQALITLWQKANPDGI